MSTSGLNEAQKAAIRRWAAAYGRKWRAELRYVWERGVCRVDVIGEDAPLLLQVRNMIGASGIERVDPEAL